MPSDPSPPPGDQALFPPFEGPGGFDRIRADLGAFLPAIRAVCERHGLTTSGLTAFERGTNVVVSNDAGQIIKLFPPFLRHQFEAERLALARLHGKVPVATPEILREAELDGWPYLVMSRLPGSTLEEAWPAMGGAERVEALARAGEIMRAAHALPTGGLESIDLGWDAFVERQIAGCEGRHRRMGLPERLVSQLPAYLSSARALLPASVVPVLLTGEYTPENLLVTRTGGAWRLTGMIDFADACLGPPEYDLLGPCLFLAAGDADLLRAFLGAYGYRLIDLSPTLSRKLMALALLHRYSNLRYQVRIEGWESQVSSLDELEQRIWPFSAR
ncbi:aminoglycoside 3'-phosphotransferase/choline kinase family protein [Sorangium sp. So ce260]|uniref:phosphotransferase family protein n=1 Tax=Sorangium sp. So ce260 TaxID=3133291 RepID=UPI003F5EA27B